MLTYLIVPVVRSFTGSITVPFSMYLDTSKTASDIAQEINREASARWEPYIQATSKSYNTHVMKFKMGTWTNPEIAFVKL